MPKMILKLRIAYVTVENMIEVDASNQDKTYHNIQKFAPESNEGKIFTQMKSPTYAIAEVDDDNNIALMGLADPVANRW